MLKDENSLIKLRIFSNITEPQLPNIPSIVDLGLDPPKQSGSFPSEHGTNDNMHLPRNPARTIAAAAQGDCGLDSGHGRYCQKDRIRVLEKW